MDLTALGDEGIGREAGVMRGEHRTVRLWLRLLACSTQIEHEVRQRLRLGFGTTLARFDYLAQLGRHPGGLRMKSLSRYLMVTGGNVTGLTDQLVADGLVSREHDPQDRRSHIVRLTPQGREAFERMAAEHEKWLDELIGRLGSTEIETLHGLLGHLRLALHQREPQHPVPGALGA